MKIDFISTLALMAGFNTDQKRADYFHVHIKTWQRWQKANKLKAHQIDALSARAGFVNAPGWTDYRFVDERLYAPSGQFVTMHEIENMWIYRQLKQLCDQPPEVQPDLFDLPKLVYHR